MASAGVSKAETEHLEGSGQLAEDDSGGAALGALDPVDHRTGHTGGVRDLRQGPPALFPFTADASCDLHNQRIYYIGHIIYYMRKGAFGTPVRLSEPADAIRDIPTTMHHL